MLYDKWYITEYGDYWIVNDSNKTESHVFKTREWAEVCARHFNNLENARHQPFVITTYDTFTLNRNNLGIGSVHNTNSYQFMPTPELSEWKCEMFGLGNQMVLKPRKGKVPNAFWRWTQYIVFGNKWIKEKQ